MGGCLPPRNRTIMNTAQKLVLLTALALGLTAVPKASSVDPLMSPKDKSLKLKVVLGSAATDPDLVRGLPKGAGVRVRAMRHPVVPGSSKADPILVSSEYAAKNPFQNYPGRQAEMIRASAAQGKQCEPGCSGACCKK